MDALFKPPKAITSPATLINEPAFKSTSPFRAFNSKIPEGKLNRALLAMLSPLIDQRAPKPPLASTLAVFNVAKDT